MNWRRAGREIAIAAAFAVPVILFVTWDKTREQPVEQEPVGIRLDEEGECAHPGMTDRFYGIEFSGDFGDGGYIVGQYYAGKGPHYENAWETVDYHYEPGFQVYDFGGPATMRFCAFGTWVVFVHDRTKRLGASKQ